MLRSMSNISPDQVRAEIDKFWQIMCGKSAGRLEEMYSPDALLFTGKARKPEPGTVALARRARQIADAGLHSEVELGSMEVEMPEAGLAIATYTYKFHHGRVEHDGILRRHRTMYGRATQIFQLDRKGALLIVHEHLSAATNPEVEKLGAQSA